MIYCVAITFHRITLYWILSQTIFAFLSYSVNIAFHYIPLYCICIVLYRIALRVGPYYTSRYVTLSLTAVALYHIAFHCIVYCYYVLLHQQCITQWYFYHRILPLKFFVKIFTKFAIWREEREILLYFHPTCLP